MEVPLRDMFDLNEDGMFVYVGDNKGKMLEGDDRVIRVRQAVLLLAIHRKGGEEVPLGDIAQMLGANSARGFLNTLRPIGQYVESKMTKGRVYRLEGNVATPMHINQRLMTLTKEGREIIPRVEKGLVQVAKKIAEEHKG